MFLRQFQRQRKCFLSERELKKALRDILTRAAWLGPDIFYWFVLSMRMQVILDPSFPARVQPLYRVGRKESSATGLDQRKTVVQTKLKQRAVTVSLLFAA